MDQSLDFQAMIQFFGGLDTTVCFTNLYKIRNATLVTSQSPPSFTTPKTPLFFSIFVDIIKDQDVGTKLSCTFFKGKF